MTRDSKGKFSVIGKWFRKFLFTLAFAVAVAVAVDYHFLTPENLGMTYSAPTLVQEVLAEAKGATYEEKIANVKAKMLDDLSIRCETLGVEDPDGAIIWDTNNKPSIGSFMFQRDTVKHYVKKYEGREITNREAIEISVDPERARALAEKIIFSEKYGASKDWVTCDEKKSITMRADLIKEIESVE